MTRKAASMFGFRTKTVLALCFSLAAAPGFLAVPAWASGVGGEVTDMANTGSDSLGGTNVTGSKTIVNDSVIDDSSSIAINKVINGVNVGYGLGGSTVMGQVTGATNDAANYNQDRHAVALQLESMVLSAVGVPQ
jgi:hypothetical protein